MISASGVRTAQDPATNATSVAGSDGSAVHAISYDHGVGISGMYVLNAASFTFFAVLTMNFLERGLAIAESPAFSSPALGASIVQQMGAEEFVQQNVGMVVDPTFRMWNQVHAQRCLVVCDASDNNQWLIRRPLGYRCCSRTR